MLPSASWPIQTRWSSINDSAVREWSCDSSQSPARYSARASDRCARGSCRNGAPRRANPIDVVRSVTASLVRPARLRSWPRTASSSASAGDTSDAGAARRSSRRASPAGAPRCIATPSARAHHTFWSVPTSSNAPVASAASAAATTSSPRPCSVRKEGEVAKSVGVDPRRTGQAGHAAEPAFGAGRIGVGEREHAEHEVAQRRLGALLDPRQEDVGAAGLHVDDEQPDALQQPLLRPLSRRAHRRGPRQVGRGQREVAAGDLVSSPGLQLLGQLVVGSVGGGDAMSPRHAPPSHAGGGEVQLAATAGGQVVVDGVAEQTVAELDRRAGVAGCPSGQPTGEQRLEGGGRIVDARRPDRPPPAPSARRARPARRRAPGHRAAARRGWRGSPRRATAGPEGRRRASAAARA